MAEPLTKKINDLPEMTAVAASNDKLLMLDVSESYVDMTKLVPMNLLSIHTASQLAANTVDSSQIKAGAIDLAHMSADSVDSSQIKAGAIDLAHMSADSVDSSQIKEGAVTNSKLGADAVNGTKIADNAIGNEHIRDSVALSVIGRSSSTSGNPADIVAGTNGHVLRLSGTTLGFGTVVAAGLATGAVTAGKIATGGVSASGQFAAQVVDTAAIKDLNVTSGKLAAGAVTEAKLGADAVDGTKIADNSINSEHYIDGSIDAVHLAAMTSAQLAGIISNETGSGALVFATSPTLVTPKLGTPASGTLTNCTGLYHVVYMQLFLPDEAIITASGRSQFFVPSYLAGGKVKQLGIGIVSASTPSVTVALGSSYGSVSGTSSIETADTLNYTLPAAKTKIPINVTCAAGTAPKGLDFWFVVLK